MTYHHGGDVISAVMVGSRSGRLKGLDTDVKTKQNRLRSSYLFTTSDDLGLERSAEKGTSHIGGSSNIVDDELDTSKLAETESSVVTS